MLAVVQVELIHRTKPDAVGKHLIYIKAIDLLGFSQVSIISGLVGQSLSSKTTYFLCASSATGCVEVVRLNGAH